MQALFEKRFLSFKRALAGVHSWDAEAIHESRIGSRRLRELVPILELDHDTQRKVGRQLRRVTRRLGTLREANVLTSILARFQREGYDARVIEPLLQAVGEETSRARDALRHRFDERDRERLIESLAHVAQQLSASETIQHSRAPIRPEVQLTAVDLRVARRASRLASAITDAGALYAPDALHGVRIALKKVRYALEVFNEARGHDDAHMMALLRKMQQTLGRLHDLEMLLKRVHDAEAHADEHLLAGLAMVADRIEIECRELHAEFMKGRASLAAIASGLSEPAGKSATSPRKAARATPSRRASRTA